VQTIGRRIAPITYGMREKRGCPGGNRLLAQTTPLLAKSAGCQLKAANRKPAKALPRSGPKIAVAQVVDLRKRSNEEPRVLAGHLRRVLHCSPQPERWIQYRWLPWAKRISRIGAPEIAVKVGATPDRPLYHCRREARLSSPSH